MKKLIVLSILCFTVLSIHAQNFIDLGLPSGTKWKKVNEAGFYTYDEAVSKFSDQLPSQTQCEELINECVWEWNGNGYKVTGPNGNSITLPAAGIRNCYDSTLNVGSYGSYWSSTPKGSNNALAIDFDSGGVYRGSDYRCYGISVRLVENE